MTTLNDQDWRRLFALLDGGWPGELTEAEADALRVLLDGVPPDWIAAGVKRLLHSGQRFRPSAAEILAAARQDPSKPTFDEAMVLIFGQGGVMNAQPPARGLWTEGSRRVARDAARTARLNEVHPLVAAFVHRVTFGRLDRVDLENEWHRKELREAWEQHVDATDGREVAVLARGGSPDGMRQLDPLSTLGLNRPAVRELTSGAEAEAA